MKSDAKWTNLSKLYLDKMFLKNLNIFWISVLQSMKIIQPSNAPNTIGISLWFKDTSNLNIEMNAALAASRYLPSG